MNDVDEIDDEDDPHFHVIFIFRIIQGLCATIDILLERGSRMSMIMDLHLYLEAFVIFVERSLGVLAKQLLEPPAN